MTTLYKEEQPSENITMDGSYLAALEYWRNTVAQEPSESIHVWMTCESSPI